MRSNAPLFLAALLAGAAPLVANADSVTIDGVVYTEGADPVFVDSPYDITAIEMMPEMISEGEIAYVIEDAAYAATVEAPYAVEEAPMVMEGETTVAIEYVDVSYETGMAGQAPVMEATDGIVYETATDGDLILSEDVRIIGTY